MPKIFRSRIVLFAAACVAFGADRARAQQTVPPSRAHHALVYDEARRRVLLTGGSTPTNGGQNFVFFNDLWDYDGKAWTPRTPSGERISGIALAFDTKNARVASFGGYNGGAVGDLRTLEGGVWTTVGKHTEMAAAEPGFVYDSKRDRFIAFGGSAGRGSAHSRTWELKGGTWTEVPGAGPPARQAHVMVYDARRDRVVVFGGMGVAPQGQRPPALADTWEFDGQRWTEVKVSGPTARNSAGAAYDSRRGRVVIFGGAGESGFLGDTWAWDGSTWTKLADSGPDPRAMGYIAYDKARDRIVLFGGRKGYPNGDLNDTWEWDGSAWQRRD